MFSNPIIVEVITKLSNFDTHDKIDNFLLKYSLNDEVTGASIQKKLTSLTTFLINNPDTEGILHSNLCYEIINEILTSYLKNKNYYSSVFDDESLFPASPNLELYLLKDGFEIKNNTLSRVLPSEINISIEEDNLISTLNFLNLNTSLGHYKQAITAYTNGDWASCNAQLRTYIESLILEMAKSLSNNQSFATTNNAIQFLAHTSSPILFTDLNEYSNDGKSFFQGFWKRLHPEGSHPGLSNKYDSIFRLNLVLIISMELLRRYEIYKN
ncbi:MAG: hypothetical protein ACRCWG_15875 [Sarcina sp.]